MDACLKYKWAGDGCREFGEFAYKAMSWPSLRRVVVKAEITRGALNPRFVVCNRSDELSQLHGEPDASFDAHGRLRVDELFARGRRRHGARESADRNAPSKTAESGVQSYRKLSPCKVSSTDFLSIPGGMGTYASLVVSAD